MNKNIFLLLLTIGFISCKNSEKKTNSVRIAEQYFQALDNSDYSKIMNHFGDSIKTIEGEHKNIYSKNEYLEILKWDLVFEPNYKILEIEYKDGIVKAEISKIGKRINFLHEKPFVMNQMITFKKGKIRVIEIDYLNFDYPTWDRNKNELLNWVNENYPELNGFINDQTENGGMKFLKAIERYNNRK